MLPLINSGDKNLLVSKIWQINLPLDTATVWKFVDRHWESLAHSNKHSLSSMTSFETSGAELSIWPRKVIGLANNASPPSTSRNSLSFEDLTIIMIPQRSNSTKELPDWKKAKTILFSWLFNTSNSRGYHAMSKSSKLLHLKVGKLRTKNPWNCARKLLISFEKVALGVYINNELFKREEESLRLT